MCPLDRALGLNLTAEHHATGPEHYAGVLADGTAFEDVHTVLSCESKRQLRRPALGNCFTSTGVQFDEMTSERLV